MSSGGRGSGRALGRKPSSLLPRPVVENGKVPLPPYLHGAGLAVPDQRRSPLNVDGLQGQLSPVGLVSGLGHILQAALLWFRGLLLQVGEHSSVQLWPLLFELSPCPDPVPSEPSPSPWQATREEAHGRGLSARVRELTSAEAGRKPKPAGALPSSSQPFTPGLKCSSTWNLSSEEGSCRDSKATGEVRGEKEAFEES